MKFKLILLLLTFSLSLISCADREDLAPVEELRWRANAPNATHYRVQTGDTLYSIAFRYDLDYQTLAEYNHLQIPYILRIGQILRLKPQSHPLIPKRHPNPISPQPQKPHHQDFRPQKGMWLWPAHGPVVTHFSPNHGVKGILIAGQKGDKIYAASSGIVAYSGSGLMGYGNLIIIKHNHEFLTAYGHNLKNRVHEGQHVEKGQMIAEMGMVNRQYWGVHFEMRRFGKPVNPIGLLPMRQP